MFEWPSVKDWHWKTSVQTAFLNCATDLDVLLSYFCHLGSISELYLAQRNIAQHSSLASTVYFKTFDSDCIYHTYINGLKCGKSNEVKVLEKEETWWHFDKMSPGPLCLVRNTVCLLSFVFGSRPVQSRPNGPTLSFAGKTCIKVWKGVWWRHLGGFARATSRLRATFFTRSFTIQRLHYTHVPVSFRIAKMKISFNFLLKIYGCTL